MSTESGDPVEVFIQRTATIEEDGETIVSIPLGAVFKYIRETGEWSKEDFVGPILATKPKNVNDYLNIQLFNRRSIFNVKIKFLKTSSYHRTDNILMMRATDGL